MNFTTDRKIMLAACRLAGAAVSDKKIKPVLACLKLALATDLAITGFNLEQGVKVRVPISQSSGSGACCISSDLLIEALDCTTDELVYFSWDADELCLTTSSGSVTIKTIAAAQFPDFPDCQGEPTAKVMAGVFSDLYALVRPSIAKSSPGGGEGGGQWVYQSCRLLLKDGQIQLHAYNGYHFAVVTGLAPFQNVPGNGQILLPPKYLPILMDACKDDPAQDISLYLSENEMSALVGTTQLYTRLMHGTFPEIQKFVMQLHQTEASATVLARDLVRAVRQASLVCPEEKPAVVVEFKPPDLLVSSYAKDLGTSEVSVQLADNDGEPFVVDGADKVLLNSKYLLDRLKAFKDDDLLALQSGGKTPFLIRRGEDCWCGLAPMGVAK